MMMKSSSKSVNSTVRTAMMTLQMTVMKVRKKKKVAVKSTLKVQMFCSENRRTKKE
jgi:hypothetical protein